MKVRQTTRKKKRNPGIIKNGHEKRTQDNRKFANDEKKNE